MRSEVLLASEDVLWAQRPDGVFLTIDVNECQDIKAHGLEIYTNVIHFSFI